MVRHVVLADVDDGVRVVAHAALAFARDTTIGRATVHAASFRLAVVRAAGAAVVPELHRVQRLVRLGGFVLLLVLLHHRKHLSAHVHQVLHGGEDHLQVALLQTGEVVLQVEVLLVHHHDVVDLPLVPPTEKRLDVVLAVGLRRQEEVRRVPHLRLERLAVLLHEVAVHSAELFLRLGILHGGLRKTAGEFGSRFVTVFVSRFAKRRRRRSSIDRSLVGFEKDANHGERAERVSGREARRGEGAR